MTLEANFIKYNSMLTAETQKEIPPAGESQINTTVENK